MVSAAAVVAMVVLSQDSVTYGCVKDTDCKGDRVCEDGRCINPDPPAQPVATPAPPPPPSRAAAAPVVEQNETPEPTAPRSSLQRDFALLGNHGAVGTGESTIRGNGVSVFGYMGKRLGEGGFAAMGAAIDVQWLSTAVDLPGGEMFLLHLAPAVCLGRGSRVILSAGPTLMSVSVNDVTQAKGIVWTALAEGVIATRSMLTIHLRGGVSADAGGAMLHLGVGLGVSPNVLR